MLLNNLTLPVYFFHCLIVCHHLIVARHHRSFVHFFVEFASSFATSFVNDRHKCSNLVNILKSKWKSVNGRHCCLIAFKVLLHMQHQLSFMCCVVAWSWALLPFLMSRLAVSILNDRRNHVCRRINHVPPVIGLGSAATWYIMVSRVQFTTLLQTQECKTVAMQDLWETKKWI